MKILGIDTSTQTASIGIVSDGVLLGDITINTPKTHSQKLMPMIDQLLNNCDMTIKDIDKIAVANGPGSFTGVRIGVTVAKGLAHPWNIGISTVSTLGAMAFNYMDSENYVCPMIDARRDQVYSGFYRFENGKVTLVIDEDLYMFEDMVEKIKVAISDSPRKVIFMGDDVSKFEDRIKDHFGDRAVISSTLGRSPRGTSVALASDQLGEDTDYLNAKVNYLRKTEAERNLEK